MWRNIESKQTQTHTHMHKHTRTWTRTQNWCLHDKLKLLKKNTDQHRELAKKKKILHPHKLQATNVDPQC